MCGHQFAESSRSLAALRVRLREGVGGAGTRVKMACLVASLDVSTLRSACFEGAVAVVPSTTLGPASPHSFLFLKFTYCKRRVWTHQHDRKRPPPLLSPPPCFPASGSSEDDAGPPATNQQRRKEATGRSWMPPSAEASRPAPPVGTITIRTARGQRRAQDQDLRRRLRRGHPHTPRCR